MRRLISIRVFILCMTLSLLSGGLGVYVTTAQDAAPYIYYYHFDLNAWVIERADGTDGRLLGQGVTNTNANAADGFWSHTGEWFAWRNGSFSAEAGGYYKWHAVRTDGTHTVNIANEFTTADYYIQWATQSDYLFVQSSLRESHPYYLIDIPNEKIIWSQVVGVTPGDINGTLVGDYFVYWEYGGQDLTHLKDSIKILSLSSGEVLSIPENDSDLEIYRQVVDPSRLTQPYLKIEVGQRVLILDVAKGEFFEIDPKGISGEYFQWSADGQYALIALHNKVCPNTEVIKMMECADLWLISPAQRLVQHIADDYVWNEGMSTGATILWADKEPIAVFAKQDGTVFTLDARSGVVKPIPNSKAALPFRWVAVGDTIYFATQTNLRTFGTASISQAQLLAPIYLTFGNTDFLPPYFGDLQVSPNGRYLGLADFEAVYDIGANSVLQFPPHTGATFGHRYGAYYKWDSSSNWLITGQVTYYAGGIGGPHRNMIFRSDGSERRELNTLWGQPEWLPTNVISHLPPAQPNSILPQPYLTLEHLGIVTGAGLNPDGTRLAVVVHVGQMLDAQLYIWSFEKATPQVEQVIPLGAECYGGESGHSCQINWSRDGRFISLGLASNDDPYDYSKNFSLIDVEKGVWLGRSDYPFEWGEKGFSVNSLEPSPIRAENATLSAEASSLDSTNDMVVIRQKETQQIVFKFSIQGKVARLWWTRDKEHLMVLQPDCSLQEWNAKDGLLGIFTPYSNCSTGWVNYTVSPKGHWAATQSIFAPLLVYGFGLNRAPISLNWYAQSISFTPDDCWLTASNSWLVTIWKLSDLIPDAPTNTDSCISLVKGTYKVNPS